MTKRKIDTGFILAAGFGKRMMPLTATRPKPMVEIAGRPMIDYTIDQLHNHGIARIIINTHYQAQVLHDHIAAMPEPRPLISYEPEILETGGGLKNALPLIGQNDFFVLSGDSILEDGAQESALARLEKFWDPAKMDILILLQPLDAMTTSASGDYDLDDQGRAIRSRNKNGALMFTSARINKASIFNGAPDGSFSYLDLLDKAEREGRLYGIIHDGLWHHISTPADAALASEYFKGRQ